MKGGLQVPTAEAKTFDLSFHFSFLFNVSILTKLEIGYLWWLNRHLFQFNCNLKNTVGSCNKKGCETFPCEYVNSCTGT